MDPEVMQANFAKLTKGTEALWAKVINKTQRKRLDEIDLQRQGPLAVLQPEMAKKLNISDDQMAQMQELVSGQRDEMQQQRQAQMQQFVGADGNFDFQKMRDFRNTDEGKAQRAEQQKQFTQSQEQLVAAIGKILTKNQKTKFNTMLGKKFDLTKLDNGPGGPGGPGGPPPANPGDASATTPASTDTPAATTPAATPKKGTSKKGSTKKKAAA